MQIPRVMGPEWSSGGVWSGGFTEAGVFHLFTFPGRKLNVASKFQDFGRVSPIGGREATRRPTAVRQTAVFLVAAGLFLDPRFVGPEAPVGET